MTLQVNVIDQNGQLFGGTFNSQDDATDWINAHKAFWGSDAIPAVTNADGSVTPAVPATYTLTQTDITAEAQALADEQTGAAAVAIGQRVIARLYAINLRKGLTSAQLMTMLADPQLTLAERLLHNGAPQTAKAIIQTVGPTYYTAAELATILAPIG